MTEKPCALTNILAAALALALPSGAAVGCLQGVVRGTSGRPLPHAVVVVAETGDRAVTNDDGRYYFPDIPAGEAALAVTDDGCFPSVALVMVRESGITTLGFTLKADAARPRKVVPPASAIKSGSVSVVTSDEDHPPTVTETGPAEDGWQITAKCDKAVYEPGEPITVAVLVKNVSQKDQALYESGLGTDFDFDVTRDGIKTLPTSYGTQNQRQQKDLQSRLSTGRGIPGLFLGPLHPGQAKTYRFAVNRFQDMTLDGMYTVVVKRETHTRTQLVAEPVSVEVRSAGVQ